MTRKPSYRGRDGKTARARRIGEEERRRIEEERRRVEAERESVHRAQQRAGEESVQRLARRGDLPQPLREENGDLIFDERGNIVYTNPSSGIPNIPLGSHNLPGNCPNPNVVPNDPVPDVPPFDPIMFQNFQNRIRNAEQASGSTQPDQGASTDVAAGQNVEDLPAAGPSQPVPASAPAPTIPVLATQIPVIPVPAIPVSAVQVPVPAAPVAPAQAVSNIPVGANPVPPVDEDAPIDENVAVGGGAAVEGHIAADPDPLLDPNPIISEPPPPRKAAVEATRKISQIHQAYKRTKPDPGDGDYRPGVPLPEEESLTTESPSPPLSSTPSSDPPGPDPVDRESPAPRRGERTAPPAGSESLSGGRPLPDPRENDDGDNDGRDDDVQPRRKRRRLSCGSWGSQDGQGGRSGRDNQGGALQPPRPPNPPPRPGLGIPRGGEGSPPTSSGTDLPSDSELFVNPGNPPSSPDSESEESESQDSESENSESQDSESENSESQDSESENSESQDSDAPPPNNDGDGEMPDRDSSPPYIFDLRAVNSSNGIIIVKPRFTFSGDVTINVYRPRP
ncbi:hypothetical protein QBC46DRAFT_411057 [Diplogelasinospora grovesii]|uniref:Uncharacterized protein n=1 Tax=Diplogelasinospora grovesii TaxID=303347 RepID=A0AAN6N1Q5_9PEZI|nr:hypothetical protein QBC46DRAFT_411057 [Diplogelasinospora grovesii]